MHSPIANQVTLVTGASTGIGREIAQLLAERGARVFVTVRNPQSANPIRDFRGFRGSKTPPGIRLSSQARITNAG